MDSPINRMIDSVQSRTPAVSKNIEKNKKSLNQRVVELVASANRTALPDRQVVPRNALVVMARAMKELSSLSDESREAGVLREVNKFISLNQNTFRANDSYAKHTDLLPAGHPLSDHNSSLSTEDYLQRYAAWLSADPGISDDVRHLVAAVYSQLPGSLEREHAFIRLNAVKASSLPAYIKLYALTAAFSFGDGNSSAARRARVKLQWRDRFGKWIEMGRGINFKFRLPDGGTASASGTYVGSNADAGYSGSWARKEANAGFVEVKGDVNIPDGIYSVSNSNAESFKARLSESELERAGVDTSKKSKYKLSSQFDESIPDLDDLLATKVDGPSGWTKNEDGSFTSDDDYKVVKKDDGYEVYRLDPEGNTGDKVGDAKTWADVQNVAAADEEAYDKYKEDVESGQLPLGDGKRPEPRYSRMNRDVQREIKQLKDQIPQNEESNKRIEDQLERALSGKDSQGRDLPEGWYSKIDPSEISETYYKDIPGATRKDEYLVATVGRDGKINYGTGGFWFNNARPAESWDQITEDTPKILDQVNVARAAIGLDPIGSSELGDFTQLSKKDYQNIRSKVDSTRNRLYTQDGFAFSRNETGFGGYSDEIIVTTEDWEPGDPEIAKIESDGGIDWSNDAMYDTWADSLRRAVNTDTSADQVSDKEIFDRRMAGESLQEVADSLGIPREEVRAREAKYARENPAAPSPGTSPVRTRKVGNIDIPLYSTVVAKEQNGDAVIVRMRDGSWVQYDTEGKEGMPWTDAKRDELIDDIKNNRDTIWFDEQGKRIFSEMLKNEIDETFPYNDAKRIALDSSKSAQERHAAVFDGAKGTDFFEFVTQDGVSPEELDPSIPRGTEVVFSDGDGQSLILRYPDGSYHHVDTGATDENNLISPQNVEEFDQENNEFLSGLFDPEGLPYARGSFIDGLRQNTILSVDGPDEPPTPPSGGLRQATESIPEVSNKPVKVNEPYAISVAQQFIKERLSKEFPEIRLEKTINAGYNSYMVLNIPDGTDLERLDDEYNLDVKNDEGNVIKLGDNSYVFYVDFPDLNASLDNPIDVDGPDEPPTPPSGGTLPKSPAPSSPAAPALFREFDVPAGAFQLRTVEYEPEGRVDEESTDFTDAPNRLAVRFPLDTLVRAFTRSLIGDVDENVIEDIVDINDDGDGNLPDLSEVGDVLENNLPINVPRGERPRASGAGSLEFNAGSEFVQAEALYNAVWLAGGDPNRVIANAYDAVNGNRNNLSKLIEAQGGVPTPEEEKLIVDITDEIKQIDDASPEEEKPITNADTGVDEDDMEFPGGLIENVPVDFNNPDYYDMDLSPYISTILEPDELGYTDNPKYIAIMVKSSSDLIQQMKSGITDGTGMALVRFNDDSTSEVPVEAIRDALQYQGINTNDILFKLRDESNDMSEEEPTRAPDSVIGPKYVELPNGYTIIRRDNRNSPDLGYISIVKEGAEVGSLYWNRDTKVVENIQINPEHRGKGVAKAVWEGAKRYEPELKHSQYRTPAGDKFARSTGDYVPPLIPMGDWTQAELDEAQAQPQPESTSLMPEQIFNQKIKDRNGGEFEVNLVKIGDIFEGAVIDKQDGTIQIIVRDKDKKKAKTELTQARDSIKTSAAGDEAMLNLPNLDRVVPPAVAEPQAPNLQAHSQMIKDLIEQAGGTVDDETADKIRDAINQKGLVDWSEADDAEIIEAITEVAGPGILEQALAELTPETPALVLDYPGPRKKGYSSENTTLDLNGNVVGEGSTVQAVTDGKIGKVLKIQDSPAYLRIEFTDGTVAVRSAKKIFAVSNKDGSKPSKPSAATAPSKIERDPVEISRRLDTPVAKAPAVARSGDTYGVNDESTVPDSVKELAQVNVVQKDFAQWGVRDAEIAKAATNRVGVEPLYELIVNYEKNRQKTGDDKPSKDELEAANDKLQEVIADTFGGRTGVSFGSKFYTVTKYGKVYFSLDLAKEEDNVGKIRFEYSGTIRNESGNRIGSVTRAVMIEKIKNQDNTFSYKMKPYNSYMKIDNDANQKTGFGSGYNRYMENWYIANKTEQVKVFAAVGADFEGGFVWALNGFNWDLSRGDSINEIKYALSRLRRESETVYEKAVADIIIKRFQDALDPVTQKYDASRLPSPMDVALAGWREGSENWPGKRAMLDTGWHGVKNLVPSATEQVQAINYRKIKNAERRVKTRQNKPNLSSATLNYLNSNEFQTEYAALGTSMDIIRSVLRNNESLAILSESDKVKLNDMVTKEIFSKDSKIPTSDIYRLRTALIKEYNADYSSTDPFSTVGEALTKFSIQQFEDGSELEAAGFKVELLSDAQGAGINQTYRVIHNDSGQVFYVKDDSTTRDRINERRDFESSNELNYPTIVAELEASVLFNLSGLLGTYSTRGSTTDENLIVMSSAGATLPTYESPINASDMFSLGLNTPSGQKFYGIDSKKLLDNLKSPEDVFRVHIVDALMNNMDRHIGNWKAAIDLIDNKILIFPVDHTLTDLNVNDGLALAETKEFLDYGRAGSALYKDTIPAIIDRAGKERAYEVYKNEVQRMIDNIDDPLVVPKENELAFLISKWGSYDAFKDSMKKRLSAMIEDGTEVNTSLRNIFNKRRGL